jgi:spore coat polysaccharide biosynthesis protein SpsF (cytidylyltransferase family)
MKVVAVIQARIKSTRFPEKITKTIQSKTLLEHVIDNAKSLNCFSEIIVATSKDEDNSFIEFTTKRSKVSFFSGDSNNLTKRIIDATSHLGPEDSVARITADNPIIFPETAKIIFNRHLTLGNDYTCAETLTHCGLEMIKVSALRSLSEMDLSSYEKEHATPYFRKAIDKYKTDQIPYSELNLEKSKDNLLTIDFPEDLILIQNLADITDLAKASKSEIYLALDKLTK